MRNCGDRVDGSGKDIGDSMSMLLERNLYILGMYIITCWDIPHPIYQCFFWHIAPNRGAVQQLFLRDKFVRFCTIARRSSKWTTTNDIYIYSFQKSTFLNAS